MRLTIRRCILLSVDEHRTLQEPPSAPWLPLPVPQPVSPAGRRAAQGTQPHAFVTVLRYPSGGNTTFWATLFSLYARYHQKLGFAGSVVYMRDNVLAAFVKEEAAQAAIRERALFVVRWDDVSPFPDDHLQVYDQVRCLCMHPSA
jgi:hypothetical protein